MVKERLRPVIKCFKLLISNNIFGWGCTSIWGIHSSKWGISASKWGICSSKWGTWRACFSSFFPKSLIFKAYREEKCCQMPLLSRPENEVARPENEVSDLNMRYKTNLSYWYICIYWFMTIVDFRVLLAPLLAPKNEVRLKIKST